MPRFTLSLEEKHIFLTSFCDKFFVTSNNCNQNPLSHLRQVACDISRKRHGILDERKIQEIQVRPLTLNCICIVTCNYFNNY
jgi:hypothetical protein